MGEGITVSINREELANIARNVKVSDKDTIAHAIVEAYQLGRMDAAKDVRELVFKDFDQAIDELKRELEFENVYNRTIYGHGF